MRKEFGRNTWGRKGIGLAAFSLGYQASCLSAVVEDESPALAKSDLFGLPGGALVEGIVFALCAGRVPFLV